MRFELTAEQQALREIIRRFLTDRAPITQTRRAVMQGYDDDLWTAMADLGLQGLSIAERDGGAGASFVEQAVVMEELGRALACTPYLATVGMAVPVLAASATEAARDWLARIAAGQTTATVALDDFGTSLDSLGTEFSAEDAGVARITGRQRLVPDGMTADLVLVLASSPNGPALLAVTADAEGVERRALDAVDPTRPLAELRFDRAPAQVIASSSLANVTRRAHAVIAAGIASEQAGCAVRCLEMAVDYAQTRVQFGRPIGSFQAIKHLLADVAITNDGALLTARHAAWAVASSSADVVNVVRIAKSLCGDAFYSAASANLQVHGGIGFTWEHDTHLYLKRALLTKRLMGAPAAHRRELARSLLSDGNPHARAV